MWGKGGVNSETLRVSSWRRGVETVSGGRRGGDVVLVEICVEIVMMAVG